MYVHACATAHGKEPRGAGTGEANLHDARIYMYVSSDERKNTSEGPPFMHACNKPASMTKNKASVFLFLVFFSFLFFLKKRRMNGSGCYVFFKKKKKSSYIYLMRPLVRFLGERERERESHTFCTSTKKWTKNSTGEHIYGIYIGRKPRKRMTVPGKKRKAFIRKRENL